MSDSAANTPPDQRAAHTRPPDRRREPLSDQPHAAAPPTAREAAPEYLSIGRIRTSHGVQGAFKMGLMTNHPEALRRLRIVYIGDARAPHQVRRVQLLGNGKEALVTVADITTPEAVAPLRGQTVWMALADAPRLPEGEYYHYQLLGLEVVDLEGRSLGRLAEILETGANDVYVVRGDQGELLLPAIAAVIREVDPEAGRMVVNPPEYY
ncbi:MAG: ribosome maturation factor RimM [Thermomicrobiales bacterium]